MIALAFKLSAEGSPVSGSLRVLDVDITLERVDDAVEALRELVGRLPDHPALLPLTDIYVADGRLVVVTPPVTGDPLDRALALYGPAAVDDAVPRLRQLAGALDRAAQAGFWHGALQPGDVIVSAEDTQLAGVGVAPALERVGVSVPLAPRYAAPEVIATRTGSPEGDQFSLAVIAHEWMFGGAVTPADGFLAVPVAQGLNVGVMQRAFDTATAADPLARFSSCLAFIVALERGAGFAPALVMEPAQDLEELPLRRDLDGAGDAPDLRQAADVPEARSADVSAGRFAGRLLNDAPPPSSPRQFGVLAVAGALMAGVILGAAGMRLLLWPADARVESTSHPFTEAPMAQGPAAPQGPTEVVDAPVTPPRDDLFPGSDSAAPSAPVTPAAAPAQADAGLLIHSTPAGAVVSIDGVPRGTTPVAIRGLELGPRRVGVSRQGYQAAERLVTLTAERPSRTLDVDLVAVARASAPPPPARPAASAPATANGSLVVDSRPAGASVIIDGRPAGNTPVTLTALAPGRRTVRIERPGYRTVTATVDVKAGERARVAARLEGGPNEE